MVKRSNFGARLARRDAILDVAGEIFSAEGYAAASMSHIASRLGGSKGTLYNYFKSKEDLFAAHVENQCQCHVAEAFAQPMIGDSPLDVLTALGERLLKAFLSNESTAFFSLIVSEAQRTPSVGRAFYDSGPKNGVRRVAEFLDHAKTEGHIVTDDSTKAAEDFLSLVHGALHLKRVLNVVPFPAPAEMRAEALRIAQVFMRAYGART